jgi:dTDP-4-amino-4,6-dideoxygalactose transaminase
MKIPLVDLKAQYATIKSEIDAAIQDVLDETGFILGEKVDAFERSFANYLNTAGAVGVASGTAALHLALLACGIGSGDEVITSSHTFIATAEPISHTGARPIFVDIDPVSYNLDPNLIEAAITPRTKAIIPVHLYGQPAAMDAILDVAQRYNLIVIEDAAQAHGAEVGGRRCGGLGHLACFSFYPGKNLGAYGDAGAVTGNDAQLLEKVRSLRNHGRTTKYEHSTIGYGERIDALQAAILDVKLPHLEQWTAARRAHAQLYDQMLQDEDLVTPVEAANVRHVYHLYVIRTKYRDALLAHLYANGVGAGIHYPVPVHRQKAYAHLGYGNLGLPVTEQVAAEVLSLPLYPELSQEQIGYVVDTVRKFRP